MTTITLAPGPTPVMTGVSTLSTPIGFEVHWNTQNINESVNILVSSTAYRANVIMNVTTINSSYVFSSLATGTYYVWVRRLDVNGNYSDWDVADGSGHSVGVSGITATNQPASALTLNGGAWSEFSANSTIFSGSYGYNSIGANGLPVDSGIGGGTAYFLASGSILPTWLYTDAINTSVNFTSNFTLFGMSGGITYTNAVPYLGVEFPISGSPSCLPLWESQGSSAGSTTRKLKVKLNIDLDWLTFTPLNSGTWFDVNIILRLSNTTLSTSKTKTWNVFRAVNYSGTNGAAGTTIINAQKTLSVEIEPGTVWDDMTRMYWDNSAGTMNIYSLSLGIIKKCSSGPPLGSSPGDLDVSVRRVYLNYSFAP